MVKANVGFCRTGEVNEELKAEEEIPGVKKLTPYSQDVVNSGSYF
jgi:hypothetical protein